MNIEAQVQLIGNPQRFNQLFDALMAAEHGESYQLIDDSRADGGNDGYLRPAKRIYAHHCFKKGVKQNSDKHILIKIRSDFNKAVALKNTRTYEVEAWSFVSNYEVSENVVNEVAKLSKAAGISATIIGPAHIMKLITKHKDVMSNFPEIQQHFIIEDLRDIKSKVGDMATVILKTKSEVSSPGEKEAIETPTDTPKINIQVRTDMQHPDVIRAIALNKPGTTVAEKTEIKTMIYSTDSDSARVQAAFSISQMYDPIKDTPQEYIDLIDIAINSAVSHGWERDIAILQSEKASFITHQQVLAQIEYWGVEMNRQMFGNLIDLDQELNAALVNLQSYEQSRKEALKLAMDSAQRANDWETYGYVLMHVGQITGSIAGIMNLHGDTELAQSNLTIAKQSLTESKNCFEKAGLYEKRIYSIHNLANQLRGFDSEKDTALMLTDQVIKESEELGLKNLNQRAKQLKDTVITGEIPDYLNGEGTHKIE